jgi:Flp pilus assembly protein TadD
MGLNKKEKIIIILGIITAVVVLVYGGIVTYQKFQPDIVVVPNITETYRAELEAEFTNKIAALTENKEQIDTVLEAGLIEQKLGLLSAAERRFKQALKINNRDYITYMYLGILYDEMERFSDADAQLRISTQLEPRDPRPFQALIILYKKHFPSEADELENIFRAASDFSESSVIWADYARFLEDRRDYRQAWIYWQEVLAAEPENEQAVAGVARTSEQLNLTK